MWIYASHILYNIYWFLQYLFYILFTFITFSKTMYYTSKETYQEISNKTNDPIVQRQTCQASWVQFPIFQSDIDFLKKVSPKIGTKTFDIPLPKLCPEERQRRRLMFKNERKLYRRTCDATWESIISVYSPDKLFPVYSQEFRWSEKRDAKTYWVSFDYTKTFTEQFKSLYDTVPKASLIKEHYKQENWEYTNGSWPLKNTYMTFECAFTDEVYFSDKIYYSTTCVDCSYTNHSEQCYMCWDVRNCNKVQYWYNLRDCSMSSYLYNCTWCSDCFMCYNLTNKKYCVENKQYATKEDYLAARDQFLGNNSDPYAYFMALLESSNVPRSEIQWFDNKQTFWNYIISNKDCTLLFDSYDTENCSYCSMIYDAQDCRDFDSRGEWARLCYELEESGRSIQSCMFSYLLWDNVSNVMYSSFCIASKNLFGCVWLTNAEYCIFNKQYTKVTYEIEVQKLIWHMVTTWEWWEFLHPSLSPFGYNETIAHEYYPLTQAQAENAGSKRLEHNYESEIESLKQSLEFANKTTANSNYRPSAGR